MVKKKLLKNLASDMLFMNPALQNALIFIDDIKATKDLTKLNDIYFLILKVSNKIDRYDELLRGNNHG
jgi:hypothetical protein